MGVCPGPGWTDSGDTAHTTNLSPPSHSSYRSLATAGGGRVAESSGTTQDTWALPGSPTTLTPFSAVYQLYSLGDPLAPSVVSWPGQESPQDLGQAQS